MRPIGQHTIELLTDNGRSVQLSRFNVEFNEKVYSSAERAEMHLLIDVRSCFMMLGWWLLCIVIR